MCHELSAEASDGENGVDTIHAEVRKAEGEGNHRVCEFDRTVLL